MATKATLDEALNQLAERKAREFSEKVRQSVEAALKPHWRPFGSGGPYVGDTVRAVVRKYLDDSQNKNDVATKEVTDAFRAQILDELLNKLPLVGELAAIEAQIERSLSDPRKESEPC